MSSTATAAFAHPSYPGGYRARRGLNWGFLGLLYTSFYLCRYNLSIANKSISDEFGFSRADMGLIITTALLAYAFGQILNGLLTDKLGGRRAMFIGAMGTIVMNTLFGAISLLPREVHDVAGASEVFTRFHLFGGEVVLSLLSLFVVVRGIDGYLQAFGAPGMIKINTAWFAQRERGRFAGIFGFMINLGRFGIFKIGPALLAGFTFLGLWQVPPLHWRWLFWVPAAICGVVALGMVMVVKQTPEEAGFPEVAETIGGGRDDSGPIRMLDVLWTIARQPVLWVTALAYACTGAVRQSVDQWFPRFMEEVHHLDLDSSQFQFLGFLIPFVASTGSLISGYLSDTIFRGRRAPVAAGIYFLETAVIMLAAQFHSANAAIVFLVLISFTANSTHSLLGTAAAMDIGGRRMAGFASGVIDSFQYFGGSLAGYFLGRLLDANWNWYFYFMAPFGLAGGLLMLTILGKMTVNGRNPLKSG